MGSGMTVGVWWDEADAAISLWVRQENEARSSGSAEAEAHAAEARRRARVARDVAFAASCAARSGACRAEPAITRAA